jgi:hypothetical protein
MVENRLVDGEPSPLLRTVLTRDKTLPRPFFSFSCFGAEAPVAVGCEELMIADVANNERVFDDDDVRAAG